MTDLDLLTSIVPLVNKPGENSTSLRLIREYKSDLVCRLMGERAVFNGKELNREEAYKHFRNLSDEDLESLIDDCGLIFH